VYGSLGETVGEVSSNGTQYLHYGTRPTLHNEKAQPVFERLDVMTLV
jgi:hypothetical protein